MNLDYMETLVLDEADLMLAMGFIDDVKKPDFLLGSLLRLGILLYKYLSAHTSSLMFLFTISQ